MSDAMGSEDLAGQLGSLESEPDPGSGNEGVVADEGPKLSAFAQSYLNTVPDDQREMVQHHVQQWDKGFSKYAERIAKQYGQYDQLGDFDSVQQAVQISQLISQDPRRATEWLISQGYGPQGPQGQPGQPQQPQQPQFTQEQLNRPVPDVDPRVQAELNRYQMALGAMNQQLQTDKFNRETERYQSEIEQGLSAVKQQYPGIPETMILHLMKGGMEMDEAVELIVAQVQAGVNQRSSPQAPKVLSSASLPPQAAKQPSEMTDDERKASLLAALQGQMGS